MKKIQTRSMMRSVSLMALTLSVLSLGTLLHVSASFAQEGTVSAIGEEDALGNDSAATAPDSSPFGVDPQVIVTDTSAPNAEAPAAQPAPPAEQAAAPAPEQPQAELNPPVDAPQATTSVTPLPPEGATGVAEGGNMLRPDAEMQKHSGQYYDANAIVPDAQMAKTPKAPPKLVDPVFEPGSRFVIAHGTAGAQSFEGQYVAATRAIKLQRYAAAMEMFEKLYKQNSKDPRVLMGLAVSQHGAGFIESAAQTYEELLQVQPNNANAIVNLMGIMKDQYPSVTLNRLLELRQKYPNNPGIPAQIGLVNADLKNYDDSMRYLEIAASLEPNNPSHMFNMAIVADRQGKADKAIKYYERALQMDASVSGTASASLPREQIYDRLVVLRRKI